MPCQHAAPQAAAGTSHSTRSAAALERHIHMLVSPVTWGGWRPGPGEELARAGPLGAAPVAGGLGACVLGHEPSRGLAFAVLLGSVWARASPRPRASSLRPGTAEAGDGPGPSEDRMRTN